MVSSVGLAWFDAIELRAVSIVESTARPWYKNVPNTCRMYFSLLSKVVLSHHLLWHIELLLCRWEQHACDVYVEVAWGCCVQTVQVLVQHIRELTGGLHVFCSPSLACCPSTEFLPSLL